nr:phosphoadenylyl-sulfate reductase [Bacilli bacterium]
MGHHGGVCAILENKEIENHNLQFQQQDVPTNLKAFATLFPNATLACSFGPEDMVIVDMLHEHAVQLPVFYLDTNLLFAETYGLRDLTIARYPRLTFHQVLPAITLQEQEAQKGANLWESAPDACCAIRKVLPLETHLKGFDGWITGIRRQQSPTRKDAQILEYDQRFGLYKLNPLAFWSEEEVWDYIKTHNVPYNPLHDHGYPSIGCAPCTRPVKEGEDPRAGRWAGFAKTECGLHQEVTS